MCKGNNKWETLDGKRLPLRKIIEANVCHVNRQSRIQGENYASPYRAIMLKSSKLRAVP
jgi:hypothetical protein